MNFIEKQTGYATNNLRGNELSSITRFYNKHAEKLFNTNPVTGISRFCFQFQEGGYFCFSIEDFQAITKNKVSSTTSNSLFMQVDCELAMKDDGYDTGNRGIVTPHQILVERLIQKSKIQSSQLGKGRKFPFVLYKSRRISMVERVCDSEE